MTPIEFARMMKRELDANLEKGEWTTWAPTRLEAMYELNHHLGKLGIALRADDPGGVTEYCADLGNIAMKTAEMFGIPPTEEPGDETILNWMCLATDARLAELFPDPVVAAQVKAVSKEYRERFDRWTQASHRRFAEWKRKQDELVEGAH